MKERLISGSMYKQKIKTVMFPIRFTLKTKTWEVVHYLQYGHTWKPLRRAQRRQMKLMATTQYQKGEVILRNLAEELLNEDECSVFKQALQHFRVSKSVPTLCTELKPVINTTEKLMLLLELSGKLPLQLQRDFHKLCSLQFSSYEAFLKYFNTGNPLSDDPKVIAKDSSGQFQVVSTGFEKKIHVVPYDETNGTDGISLPGTSVTSGVYSEFDDHSRNGTVTKEEAEMILNHSLMKPVRAADQYQPQNQDMSKTPSRVSLKSLQLSQKSKGHSRKSSTHSNHHLNRIPSKSTSTVNPESPTIQPEGSNSKKQVLLNRREDGSLGVGIKGGKEYGTPIMVYLVESNSQAEEQGLSVGDRILEVNGTDFRQLTHAEAVILMLNAWNLIMEVETSHEVDGHRLVSPTTGNSTDVIIYPTNGGKLGCAVFRDPVAGDIIVKEVEANSPADKAGLKKGDCIMKIDGLSVNILSEKQISGLTNSKRVKLNIKRSLYDKENNPPLKTGTDTVGSDEVFTPMRLPSPSSPSSPPDAFFASSTPRYPAQNVNHHDHHHQLPGRTLSSNLADNKGTVSHVWRDDGHHYPHDHRDTRHHVTTTYAKHNQNLYIPRQSTYTPRMTMVYHTKSAANTHERSRSVTRIKKQMPQYVRSRSQSPHSLRNAPSLTTEDRVVLHAVQSGIQKRQRALRLSLYQLPDTNDDDWKI
ncbi:uncharacterized protein LOC124276860 isoform X2 [Haliotis rubra]|uniref:uncharacterized protein LOC124276860 isoform X2 n=1 Tax=Haliotis rubra TaxID=36100 RepID=UPI001EE50386|nr:uncharacterized protein LOC124276860 isoform X2 [Haliotis rubra]